MGVIDAVRINRRSIRFRHEDLVKLLDNFRSIRIDFHFDPQLIILWEERVNFNFLLIYNLVKKLKKKKTKMDKSARKFVNYDVIEVWI